MQLAPPPSPSHPPPTIPHPIHARLAVMDDLEFTFPSLPHCPREKRRPLRCPSGQVCISTDHQESFIPCRDIDWNPLPDDLELLLSPLYAGTMDTGILGSALATVVNCGYRHASCVFGIYRCCRGNLRPTSQSFGKASTC